MQTYPVKAKVMSKIHYSSYYPKYIIKVDIKKLASMLITLDTKEKLNYWENKSINQFVIVNYK